MGHRGVLAGSSRVGAILLGIAGAVACAAGAPLAATGGAAATPLELIVLGSGGPAALGRAASSYLLLLDGEPRILVDAGPGSFARIGEAHLPLDGLDVVLLTHLHVDHAAELPGLVKARAVAASRPVHFEVFGPAGQRPAPGSAAFPSTSRFIDLMFGPEGAFAYLKDFSAPITFHVTDLSPAPARTPRTLVDREALRISAIGGHHGDAPAIIYRVDYRGHSVAFSGDIDAHGLPALQSIARGVNLLVFDAVVLDPPGSPDVLYSLHSPPRAIGALAAADEVGGLLLSHLSPAVEGARTAVTASIASHYHGSVSFAADGMHLRP